MIILTVFFLESIFEKVKHAQYKPLDFEVFTQFCCKQFCTCFCNNFLDWSNHAHVISEPKNQEKNRIFQFLEIQIYQYVSDYVLKKLKSVTSELVPEKLKRTRFIHKYFFFEKLLFHRLSPLPYTRP